MGVLDNNNPQRPTVPPASLAANRVKMLTRQTYQQMVQAFNQGTKIFWQNPNGVSPAEISAELGADAKEIFELHAKLGALLASVNPEAISEASSLVGQFTMNNDGTVTINQ